MNYRTNPSNSNSTGRRKNHQTLLMHLDAILPPTLDWSQAGPRYIFPLRVMRRAPCYRRRSPKSHPHLASLGQRVVARRLAVRRTIFSGGKSSKSSAPIHATTVSAYLVSSPERRSQNQKNYGQLRDCSAGNYVYRTGCSSGLHNS